MEIENTEQFRKLVSRNLYENIIPFWQTYTIDHDNGGYYGRISNDLQIDPKAPKSFILTSRILWSFSALYQFNPEKEYLYLARRAYEYLINKFLDKEFGGFYWLLNYHGEAIEDVKKIYGQAFGIYSLCEYYAATGDQTVLDLAVGIFNLIEKHNHDDENGGYFEAAYRDWTLAENMALSEVDMAEKKSMNTHLHLMEAYTNLYRFWKDDRIRIRLQELIECHFNHIIDPETHHLRLFFDEQWKSKSKVVSFGHDIETSWLIVEAAEVLGNDQIITRAKELALQMVDATMREGISNQNSIYLEKNGAGKLKTEKFDWWLQSEAVVGLLNACQISARRDYLKAAMRIWATIENTFVDSVNGEWFYAVDDQGIPIPSESKVCEWKGPYHTIRACIEILRRIETL